MLQGEVQNQPHKGSVLVALAILGIFMLLFVHLWVYASTASLYAISMVYILSSLLLLNIATPMMFLECKRMMSPSVPETSSVHTAVMLSISLLMITGYFAKAAFGYYSFVIPRRTLWICDIFDSFSLFVFPVMWCVFRLCEYFSKEAETTAFGNGKSTNYQQYESLRPADSDAGSIYYRQYGSRLHTVEGLQVGSVSGQCVMRREGAIEGVDEVNRMFIVQSTEETSPFPRVV